MGFRAPGCIRRYQPTWRYEHEFPDGRKVMANLYPVEYLGVFRTLMDKEWLSKRASAYFKERDPLALLALDKMLMVTAFAKPLQVQR